MSNSERQLAFDRLWNDKDVKTPGISETPNDREQEIWLMLPRALRCAMYLPELSERHGVGYWQLIYHNNVTGARENEEDASCVIDDDYMLEAMTPVVTDHTPARVETSDG